MAISDKLQTLLVGKRDVVNKINEKAGTSLLVNSKWEDVINAVDSIKTENKSIGTPVLRNMMVENVYLNTNLSIDEVIAECEKLTYCTFESGYPSYPLITTNIALTIIKLETMYAILDTNTYYLYFISHVEAAEMFGQLTGTTIDFVGWNPSFNGIISINDIIDNSTSFSSTTDVGFYDRNNGIDVVYEMPEAALNHLIPSLLSSTPFEV